MFFPLTFPRNSGILAQDDYSFTSVSDRRVFLPERMVTMDRRERQFLYFALVVLGNCLYVLTVKLFLLPAGLISTGTTGIALAVNHATGLPMPVFILLFNLVMLIL